MCEAEGISNPALKLIILSGPLSGQTFNFIPGSQVHVGRIVRGNALTIKDAGVSSKHLLFRFELNVGGWMVSDLDSSNGTFLNGRLLDPFDPAQLSQGDVIKIGELTSISVDIGVIEESMLRRNPPRRRGRNLAEKDTKLNDMKLGKGRSKDLDGMMDKLGKNETKGEEMAAGPIRVSSVKQEKVSGIWESSCDDGVGVRVVEKEEINEVPKRVTRGRKKKEILNVDVGELKERQDVSMKRTTRSMRQGKILESLEDNAGQENRKTRKGRRGKHNVEADTLRENVHLEKEEVGLRSDSRLDETIDAIADMPVNEVAEIREGKSPADPLVKEKGVHSGVESSVSLATSSGCKHHDGVGLNLENMTVGDLFDHWEVSLPKQIIDATEQMISDMREKSKKFHEFRKQQKNAKDNVNIPVDDSCRDP